MWFVGGNQDRGSTVLDGLTAEVNRVELQAETCERALGVYQRDHAELDRRVRRLETELEELRRARIEAYSRWWDTREDRDRAVHVARRLRRRLERLRRRLSCQGLAEG
ncbi:hypothetical protein EV190_11690 [Actinorugispora endophytica]|uniref:Uncharacterized protein n=1 Tax=Actinorugispora endophytica TaxID=1605990 RepID=A0A4R6UU65_9ACTN|nr:hypothetical protein EV190_11690 [Actinorugispora endophytica]